MQAYPAIIGNKGGRTDNVFFYDVEADGFTLDDKREKTEANDLPDVLAVGKRSRSRQPDR